MLLENLNYLVIETEKEVSQVSKDPGKQLQDVTKVAQAAVNIAKTATKHAQDQQSQINNQQSNPNSVPQDQTDDQTDEGSDIQDEMDAEDDLNGDGVIDDMDSQESQEPQEYASIKKYYLVEKLYDLKNILTQYNINNNELNTLLLFSNDISYPVLLSIATSLADIIKKQIIEVKKYAKK